MGKYLRLVPKSWNWTLIVPRPPGSGMACEPPTRKLAQSSAVGNQAWPGEDFGYVLRFQGLEECQKPRAIVQHARDNVCCLAIRCPRHTTQSGRDRYQSRIEYRLTDGAAQYILVTMLRRQEVEGQGAELSPRHLGNNDIQLHLHHAAHVQRVDHAIVLIDLPLGWPCFDLGDVHDGVPVLRLCNGACQDDGVVPKRDDLDTRRGHSLANCLFQRFHVHLHDHVDVFFRAFQISHEEPADAGINTQDHDRVFLFRYGRDMYHAVLLIDDRPDRLPVGHLELQAAVDGEDQRPGGQDVDGDRTDRVSSTGGVACRQAAAEKQDQKQSKRNRVVRDCSTGLQLAATQPWHALLCDVCGASYHLIYQLSVFSCQSGRRPLTN